MNQDQIDRIWLLMNLKVDKNIWYTSIRQLK